MTDRLGSIDEEVWIDAPPEVVFEDFTDLDLWKRWQAVDGAVDARPRGRVSASHRRRRGGVG